MEFLDPTKITQVFQLPFTTLLLYGIIGIGTFAGAVMAYMRGQKEQATPTQNVLLREGSITDMGPIREMAACMKLHYGIAEKQLEAVLLILEVIRSELARQREEEVGKLKDELAQLKFELQNKNKSRGT